MLRNLYEAIFERDKKHRCEVCNKECNSRRKAEEHAQIPVETQIFPLGLIFKSEPAEGFEELGEGHEVLCYSQVGWRHERIYELRYANNCGRNEGRIAVQEELLEDLRNRTCRFLNPAEFEAFKIIYAATIYQLKREKGIGIENLARTAEIPGQKAPQ